MADLVYFAATRCRSPFIRLVALLGLVGSLAGAGCSSDDPTSPALDLVADEVACEFRFGSSAERTIGPLKPGNSETLQVNDYTEVRVGITPTALIVGVDRTVADWDVSVALEEIPDEGLTFEGEWIDSGHPGYIITCFRGRGPG